MAREKEKERKQRKEKRRREKGKKKKGEKGKNSLALFFVDFSFSSKKLKFSKNGKKWF